MEPNIAIATMTCENKGSFELMKASLEALSRLPYAVYIADGGSSREFVESLEKMGHSVEQVLGDLTAQHKGAILRASDSHDFVLYTEPDKYDWFCQGLEETVELYMGGEQGFGVVSRNVEQLKTFPETQQKWERKMNDLITKRIGINGDFIYGPKLFPQLLGYSVRGIDRDMGWGTLMFLVAKAHKLGVPINNIYTAVSWPIGKRDIDNEEYRMKQFNDNKAGFELGLR